MHPLTLRDRIWNRACEGGGEAPGAGDSALAALLLFHGPCMNGGVLHAVECLSPAQLTESEAGFRFFGLSSTAELLQRAREIVSVGKDLEEYGSTFDQEYWGQIPDDSTLVKRFELHHESHPSDYSPLH